jgi:hypothetical protein
MTNQSENNDLTVFRINLNTRHLTLGDTGNRLKLIARN